MKQGRYLPELTSLLFLSVIAATSLLARNAKDSVWLAGKDNIRVVHEHASFDILQSTIFFNSQCQTSINCLNFPLVGARPAVSLAPQPDRRNVEQKIADEFSGISAYPGGRFIYDTMLAGLDFMDFYRRKTTFTYMNFKIGSTFGGAGRGFLKTGINYDF